MTPIFLGTKAVSIGLEASWYRCWPCSSAQNNPLIYFRAYSYPSSPAHHMGFPRPFSFALLPASTSRRLHVKVPWSGVAATGAGAGLSILLMSTKRLEGSSASARCLSPLEQIILQTKLSCLSLLLSFTGAIHGEVYGKQFRQAAVVTGFLGAAFTSRLAPRFEPRCSC